MFINDLVHTSQVANLIDGFRPHHLQYGNVLELPRCTSHTRARVNADNTGSHTSAMTGRCCAMSVSYTHLDVYKRQVVTVS